MTAPSVPVRVHVVAGGFPRGSAAGHDIDYARLRILQLLQEEGCATASVASDFSDLDGWLPKSDLLVTYVAGPSVGSDGSTRALGYVRECGAGSVAYFALGHCHTPTTNIQPFVDASVDAEGVTPLDFRGPWETDAFARLLRNGIEWGLGARRAH